MLKQLSKHIDRKLEKLLENTGDMALKRRARRIIEELNPQDGDNILDVGCGDGYYLYLLSNLGLELRLTGIDSDPNALNTARKNLKGKRVRLVKVDLMGRLPFPANHFDKAVMSEVAEHLQDDVKGLKNVYKVIKPAGFLCMTIPSANYPFLWDPVNWTEEHLFGKHTERGFWAGIWSQHRRLYRPLQIKRVAEKAGFKITHIESLTWWCIPFNHNIVNLAAIKLYGGQLSPKMARAMSKYKRENNKPLLLKTAFMILNSVDKLNDFYQPKNSGVGILIKAAK